MYNSSPPSTKTFKALTAKAWCGCAVSTRRNKMLASNRQRLTTGRPHVRGKHQRRHLLAVGLNRRDYWAAWLNNHLTHPAPLLDYHRFQLPSAHDALLLK